ncbi:MAG: UDP-N-acetylmuramate--L-alanine ligase, partial [Dialister sp.]|nr:UDP-N-acetylmuramate--L-alanine ligase [Dialister sp.]
MDLTKYHSFHFIGIGGMGMRALAVILLDKGERISGSDVADSPFLRDFRKKGAEIYIGHEASHVKGADCVVISSAISEENPELLEARRLGIPVFHRSDVLAAMFHWGKGIAVAGAHGKSTTSAMVGQIFYEAGKDPTIVLGAAASYIGGNSSLGKGEYVIAEADESDGSFLKFSPYMTVVTNIEDDHLDHYGSVENIRRAFSEFISHICYEDGVAIVCTDSEGVCAILPEIHKACITYGLNEKADYRAVNKRYEKRHLLFDVVHEGKTLGTIELQIPGSHNIRDALGAVIAALCCGIPMETIETALSHFVGVKRRFETKSR